MPRQSPKKSSAKAARSARSAAKRASQDKIIMAARKLFAENGYEHATLRDIAQEAGLGLATLFNHISDKRDLIYLIFDEEVDSLNDRALAAPRAWQTFTEKMLAVTEHHFRQLAGEPTLARILLSEVLQQTPGPHLERHLTMRARFISGMERMVAEAQASGELKPQPSADVIAQSIFFAYSGFSRWWISQPSPSWRGGQKQFQTVLEIMTEGIRADAPTAPRKSAPRKSKAKRTR